MKLDFKGDGPWKLRRRVYDTGRTVLDCLILATDRNCETVTAFKDSVSFVSG